MIDTRLISIAAFMKRHLPVARKQPREKLLAFIEWYWRDARVGVVQSRGRIVGLALARCLDAIEEAEVPYCHHEQGRIVWVEHIVSLHPEGLRALMNLVVRRFGPREVLAGHVFKRDGELRKLPWNTVVRLIDGVGIHEHKHSGAAGGT